MYYVFRWILSVKREPLTDTMKMNGPFPDRYDAVEFIRQESQALYTLVCSKKTNRLAEYSRRLKEIDDGVPDYLPGAREAEQSSMNFCLEDLQRLVKGRKAIGDEHWYNLDGVRWELRKAEELANRDVLQVYTSGAKNHWALWMDSYR